MKDKSEIQIDSQVYHRGLKKNGVFNEVCMALEVMNPDPTSIFIQFDGEVDPKEVSVELCDVKDFEPPKLCQKCLKPLAFDELTMCAGCLNGIQEKLGG